MQYLNYQLHTIIFRVKQRTGPATQQCHVGSAKPQTVPHPNTKSRLWVRPTGYSVVHLAVKPWREAGHTHCMSCNVPCVVGADEEQLISMYHSLGQSDIAWKDWWDYLLPISASAASSLPRWEVFYYQKLKPGTEIQACENWSEKRKMLSLAI